MIEKLESRRLPAVIGSIDPTFGDGGAITIPNEPFLGTSVVSKVLPDGKVLIARIAHDAQKPLVLTRYLPGGQPASTRSSTSIASKAARRRT